MRNDDIEAMVGMSEHEEAETLAAVLRGIADVEAGRTHSVQEAFEWLETAANRAEVSDKRGGWQVVSGLSNAQ